MGPKARGSVNGGFQTMVRVWSGEQIPVPPSNLNFASVLPHFNLFVTSFLILTSFQPLRIQQSRTTVWKPRFTDLWITETKAKRNNMISELTTFRITKAKAKQNYGGIIGHFEHECKNSFYMQFLKESKSERFLCNRGG